MITMRIKGGLGNQLFQYSAAYSLSKRLKQELQFNPCFTDNMTPRGYRLSNLKIKYNRIVSDSELSREIVFFKKKYPNKIIRILDCNKIKCGNNLYWIETKDELQLDFWKINYKNVYVDGYFQSDKYFKKYRQDILEQIRPAYEPEQQYLLALDRIQNCNSVAVHVRRSDF